jgi:hypothetical protein
MRGGVGEGASAKQADPTETRLVGQLRVILIGECETLLCGHSQLSV